jgi:hypothetical protein
LKDNDLVLHRSLYTECVEELHGFTQVPDIPFIGETKIMQFLWPVKAHIGHLAIDRRCRVLELHDPNLDKPATYDGSTFNFRRTKKARFNTNACKISVSPGLLASAKRLES